MSSGFPQTSKPAVPPDTVRAGKIERPSLFLPRSLEPEVFFMIPAFDNLILGSIPDGTADCWSSTAPSSPMNVICSSNWPISSG